MMLDLFAGAGGVSLGARMIGVDELGIEIDRDACATRDAAGFTTLRADIGALDPREVAPGTRAMWASPPCTSFSTAGKRLGMTADAAAIDLAMECLEHGAALDWDTLADRCADPRSALVLQPHRWILALDDTLEIIAFEQVPPVLPMWERTAKWLRGFDRPYHVWTGILQAADFGVPQTRQRAFLIASRRAPVSPPTATHSRYGGLWTKPWVSMADALGWAGAVATDSGNGYAHDYERSSDRPAPTVIERARRWRLRNGNQEKACERSVDEPAGTLFFGNRLKDVSWIVRTRGDRAPGGGNVFAADDPSWALTENARSWTRDRRREAEGAIRITIEEASVLQGFPRNFPWRGSRTACFRQAGNAVPPIVAAHVLSVLYGIDVPKIGAAA